ncbi:DNA-directed RNA polymerase III subunit RPC7-like [Drosophila eugracilis]|uniref:DNA-directed RNA polymerase III subunit RPC7-like n=1 Tax=Drosophila eugracilis TaxID=29029 RepID=UPI0007E800A9|nr:DNA-directed RNA polymerase III subunit RPC7-like [Drosophila eugracilis]
MAGRGRGGKTGTLTAEQMAMLGCTKDLPVQTAPPPTFPPLLNRPTNIETTTPQNYQLLWKEDFLNRMRDSPYYIVSASHKGQNQEHKDWREKAMARMKLKTQPEFNYKTMPQELNISSRKRRGADVRPKLLAKKTNIEDRLKVLEQKELKSGGGEQDENKQGSDSEQEEEQDDPEAALDDEMDEDNDYGATYFDNGEAFNDEDDNLDDGPVY